MFTFRRISIGALALIATANSPLRAQAGTPSVQLAFGYECGDRFLVRNDGAQPVVIEYAVAGSPNRFPLHLNARQQVEIASPQAANLELRVNGKVVASEPKSSRACAGQNDGPVVVRPLDQNNANAAPAPQQADQTTTYPYQSPEVTYSDYSDYSYPYYPYPYYSYGYYPYAYYGPSIGF
jgi:hypothetical protein